MVACPQDQGTSQSPLATRNGAFETDLNFSSSTLYQLQIAILEARVAALEAELEHQREQRQAVVDRYEWVLERK